MEHNYYIYDKRIILKPLTKKHLELIRTWRNKDNIRKYFIYRGIITSSDQLHWFEKYINNKNDIMFIIEEKEVNRPIGTVSLYNIDWSLKKAEFGRLMIGDKKNLGKNYGFEATKAICNFGIKKLMLKKIYLEVLLENKRAITIYEKIGFEKVNVLEKHDIKLLTMILHSESFSQ